MNRSGCAKILQISIGSSLAGCSSLVSRDCCKTNECENNMRAIVLVCLLSSVYDSRTLHQLFEPLVLTAREGIELIKMNFIAISLHWTVKL